MALLSALKCWLIDGLRLKRLWCWPRLRETSGKPARTSFSEACFCELAYSWFGNWVQLRTGVAWGFRPEHYSRETRSGWPEGKWSEFWGCSPKPFGICSALLVNQQVFLQFIFLLIIYSLQYLFCSLTVPLNLCGSFLVWHLQEAFCTAMWMSWAISVCPSIIWHLLVSTFSR